jgi:hypothetical protein
MYLSQHGRGGFIEGNVSDKFGKRKQLNLTFFAHNSDMQIMHLKFRNIPKQK